MRGYRGALNPKPYLGDQSVRAVRNNGEGWECEWVSSKENPFFAPWWCRV